MTEPDILTDEIRGLIAGIAELDPGAIGPGTNFVSDLEMDSLMSLELLAALERRYGIHIPEESLPSLFTLGGVVEVVSSQLQAARQAS